MAYVRGSNQAFFTRQESKMCCFCIEESEIKLFRETLLRFFFSSDKDGNFEIEMKCTLHERA